MEAIQGAGGLAGLISTVIDATLIRWRDRAKGAHYFVWLQRSIQIQLQPHSQHLRQPDQDVARAVDVLAQPAGAADEQRGRASASGLGDQAQVVVLHSLGAGHAVLGNHHVNGADLRDAGSLHF